MTRARDLSNLMGSGNFSSTTFTATAGQTAFTIAHTVGFVQVFMNGLLLDLTTDYTSNGSAITLTTAAAAGDEIEVVKYNTFSVGDAVPASGGTFTGNVNIPGHVVQVVEGSMDDRLALSTGGNWTQVTNLTASITPSSTSSKILVQCNVNLSGHQSYYTVGARLYVNGSHLSDASSNDATYSNDNGCWFAVGAQQWSNYIREQATAQYLHSPASTSAQVYSLYVNDQRDSSTVLVNRYYYQTNASYMYTTRSNFLLMEIAQ